MMKFRKDLEEKRQFLEQKNKDLLDEVEKMRYSAGSLEGECLDSFDLDLQD